MLDLSKKYPEGEVERAGKAFENYLARHFPSKLQSWREKGIVTLNTDLPVGKKARKLWYQYQAKSVGGSIEALGLALIPEAQGNYEYEILSDREMDEIWEEVVDFSTISDKISTMKITGINADRRRENARQRQETAAKRTPQEQLARLDQSFGAGVGAKKERAKLAARIKASR